MRIQGCIRVMAGAFVLASLVLSQVHSEYWLLFTAFVGLNLVQSAFTGICLPTKVLKRFSVCEV